MQSRSIYSISFFLAIIIQPLAQSLAQDSLKRELIVLQKKTNLSEDSLQEKINKLQIKFGFTTDSIHLLKQTDSQENKFKSIQSKINTSANGIQSKINTPLDSVNMKLESAKRKWQSKLDSLKQGGAVTEVKKYQQKLDSLEKLPEQQYAKLLAVQVKLKNGLANSTDKLLDSLQVIKGKANSKLAEVNNATSSVGIGSLSKDIKTELPTTLGNSQLPGNLGLKSVLPQMPGVNNPISGSTNIPNPRSGNPINTNAKLPGIQNLNSSLPTMPKEVKEITNGINEATIATKEIRGASKQANQYTKEAKAIKEEGLDNTKKIPELIEKQASNIKEVNAFEGQKAAVEKEMKLQKELIEKYKNEKAIKEEMDKKVKEMANDKITQFQIKVDASMKDLKKYKKKFSDVQDMRNLPKWTPNPMKGLSWRERVVPGLTLETISKNKTWIELAPQFYFKLNGSWSAGVGWVYRFSMDADKFTFDDFGNLNGQKIFAQYHAFKGFFLRTEIEHTRWKNWATGLDKDYRVDLYIMTIGLGKSFSFTEKIKGNIQTLYHYSWQSLDPYPSVIEIRFGFDFSLKPKKREPWKTKLKELEKLAN